MSNNGKLLSGEKEFQFLPVDTIVHTQNQTESSFSVWHWHWQWHYHSSPANRIGTEENAVGVLGIVSICERKSLPFLPRCHQIDLPYVWFGFRYLWFYAMPSMPLIQNSQVHQNYIVFVCGLLGLYSIALRIMYDFHANLCLYVHSIHKYTRFDRLYGILSFISDSFKNHN